MSDKRGGVSAPRLIFGLGLMAMGAIFLLGELNIVYIRDVIRWWPLIPAAVGASMLLRPGGTSNRAFGGALVGGGVWLLLYDFGLIWFDLFDAWPVLLIGAGLFVVWRAWSGDDEPLLPPRQPSPPQQPSPPATDERADGDTMSIFAFVNNVEKTPASATFRGADLTAIMGGCTLDLRRANLAPEGAVIDAFAFWGGIEIIVPEGWAVTNKVMPLFGGSEDHTLPASGAEQRLLVRGSSIMAGVEIGHQASERQQGDEMDIGA